MILVAALQVKQQHSLILILAHFSRVPGEVRSNASSLIAFNV